MTRGWRETDTVAATPLSAMIYKQNKNKENFKEKKILSHLLGPCTKYRTYCIFSLLKKVTETTCSVNCKYFFMIFQTQFSSWFFTQKTRVADPDPDLVGSGSLFAGPDPKFSTLLI
jgi:hypothetical protein